MCRPPSLQVLPLPFWLACESSGFRSSLLATRPIRAKSLSALSRALASSAAFPTTFRFCLRSPSLWTIREAPPPARKVPSPARESPHLSREAPPTASRLNGFVTVQASLVHGITCITRFFVQVSNKTSVFVISRFGLNTVTRIHYVLMYMRDLYMKPPA